jgi:signal transduction histidine kinase
VTDLDALWLATLQSVVNRAAHELKDALNGVHLNLEALRSRSAKPGVAGRDLTSFAESAADQLEAVSARTESLLFLARPHRPADSPTDVAVTLKHLATLLVPATKADGGKLVVEGYDVSVQTSAPAQAVRLGLASGLMDLTKEGGSCRCILEAADGTVVRFSHEAANTPKLETAVATAIGTHQIRTERSGSDLLIVFPGL